MNAEMKAPAAATIAVITVSATVTTIAAAPKSEANPKRFIKMYINDIIIYLLSLLRGNQ
jgi:hypothetical protein